MKQLIQTFTLTLVILSTNNLYSQTWDWAKSAVGASNDYPNSSTTDNSGNVYVTGYYQSFSLSFSGTTITNANVGMEDVFLVKYDASGNVVWVRGAGGVRADRSYDVCTDASGNVYITGAFSSASITFGSTTLTNNGPVDTDDIFVVKYDAGGNVLWAKNHGTTYHDKGLAICTDPSGNVYITGDFFEDNITVGSTTLINSGGVDMLVIKYNSSGTVQWAKSAGSTDLDFGTAIVADGSGNLYVAGAFMNASIDFGTNAIGNTAAQRDVFLVKYNSSTGTDTWAIGAGGSENDTPSDIIVDASGNIYMTGYYASPTITFGSDLFNNAGGLDYFLVKYNSSGIAQWADAGGGNFTDYGGRLVLDGSGNLYVAGTFYGADLTLGTFTISNNGSTDVFFAKYNSSGTITWLEGYGGTSGDDPAGISVDASGNIFVSGSFSTSITFGSTTLVNGNPGATDIFVARLDPTPNGVGFNNMAIDENLTIYPNPTSNIFTIQLPENTSPNEIALFNAQGQQIAITMDFEGTGGELIFDLSNQPDGVYFIKVGSVIQKIIKE